MNKNVMRWSFVALAVLSMTACKDEPDHIFEPTDLVSTSNGLFVVGSGNNYSGISGDLTYYDYQTGKSSPKVFQAANGRALGTNPNAGITYGSKVYLTVTEENVIEVLDKNTLKEVRQIRTTDQLGDKRGIKPRQLFAMNGHVYYTTYGGENGSVAEIDTTAFKLTRSWKVGSYPEGITGTPVEGGHLFVANSNYGRGKGTVSFIDLNKQDVSQSVNTTSVDGIKNPMQVFVSGGEYYVVDLGHYDEKPPYAQSGNGLKKIVRGNDKYSSETVAPATMAALHNNTFFTVDAPYGAGAVTYYKYVSGKATQLQGMKVDSPCAINVDPLSGHLFIASNSLVGGYASYNTNGYVREFSEDGKQVAEFSCGVGPSCIFFNTSLLWR